LSLEVVTGGFDLGSLSKRTMQAFSTFCI
jgi:hypothetical protein